MSFADSDVLPSLAELGLTRRSLVVICVCASVIVRLIGLLRQGNERARAPARQSWPCPVSGKFKHQKFYLKSWSLPMLEFLQLREGNFLTQSD
jgi:hypothetical protein